MNNPQCSGGRPLYRLLAIQLATLCSTLLRSLFLQRRFTTDFNQNKAIDQIDKDESVPSDLIRVSRVSHPVEVGQGFGKIWNPCASSNHLGVQVIQSQKAWAIWRCKFLCMYCMYGFACHNLRIPMTRRMSRLIKADPFRSSWYPPTGHPVDLVIRFTQAVHFQSRQSFGPMANNSLPRMDELRLLQPG